QTLLAEPGGAFGWFLDDVRIVARAAPQAVPGGTPAGALRQLLDMADRLNSGTRAAPDEDRERLAQPVACLKRLPVSPRPHHPDFARQVALRADAVAPFRVELGRLQD